MLFNYLLNDHLLDDVRLKKFGFILKNGNYYLEKPIKNKDFIAKIKLSNSEFSVDLFDVNFQENYELLDNENFQGSFVLGLRQEVSNLVDEIKKKCLTYSNLENDVIAHIKKKYNVDPEHPWSAYPTFATFKCTNNNKWFALIMHIQANCLNVGGKYMLSVINIKLPPEKILSIIDNKSIFPAYHMNKKNWVTIVLNKEISSKTLFKLIDESHDLVQGKQF